MVLHLDYLEAKLEELKTQLNNPLLTLGKNKMPDTLAPKKTIHAKRVR